MTELTRARLLVRARTRLNILQMLGQGKVTYYMQRKLREAYAELKAAKQRAKKVK